MGRRARNLAKRLSGWIPRRPKPVILMYHRVAEESFDPGGLAVSPQNFEHQLSCLSETRTVYPLNEFAARNADGTLAEDAVAVTFDDGYCCSAGVAAPLLERFHMPTTIFLPAELIEKGGQFWWHELEEIILEYDGPSLPLGTEEIALGEKSADDRRWRPGAPPRTPRQNACRYVQRELIAKAPTEIEDSMESLRKASGRDGRRTSSKGPMTPEQVRRLVGGVINFGSHSLTHAWLTSLDPSEQAREIGESVERCEALTGARPTAFAYPFGAFDSQTQTLVEQAGFECACSVEEGPVGSGSRPFALPRVQVGNWSARKLSRVLRNL